MNLELNRRLHELYDKKNKLYYHGREQGKRPYTGTYIFITDNMGYAAGYSDGDKLYTYTVPFGEDKIFSIKNKKDLLVLQQYVNNETINAVLRDSGAGQEMDWAALSYISTDDYEMPEELFQHAGYLAIRLKERQGIDSLYVFDENDLDFKGEIDISTPENIKKIGDFYREFTKDKNFLQERIIKELTLLVEGQHGTIDNGNEQGSIDNGNENGHVVADGVADKAAEKLFNIPDPNTAMNRQATSAMGQQQAKTPSPSDPKGTLVGFIEDRFSSPIGGNKKIPGTNIYLNPKSLDEFEADVKAVSNDVGDMFVSQADADIYHSDIVNAVDKQDVYRGYIGNAYDGQDTITWHRINKSDDFGFSVSYLDFNKNPENHAQRDKLMQIVKQKNPRYNFLPFYWREEWNRRYDSENDMNNDSLQNY
jgi:hypothetical protein